MQEIIFSNIDDLYKRIGQNVAKIRKAKKISQLNLSSSNGTKIRRTYLCC